MAMVVHRFDGPDRFVAGTVGQPGERTFFLQARQGNRITSVACEKQQVSVLAENLEKVLDEIARRSAAAVPPTVNAAADVDPLDAPITEEFRVGTMTLAWDGETQQVVIEMFSAENSGGTEDVEFGDGPAALDSENMSTKSVSAEDVPEPTADEVFVVRITPRYARDFVARANALVSAGRPACPFCLQPIDPEGHICPRANGYRRALF